jgi:hypothetical protein
MPGAEARRPKREELEEERPAHPEEYRAILLRRLPSMGLQILAAAAAAEPPAGAGAVMAALVSRS